MKKLTLKQRSKDYQTEIKYWLYHIGMSPGYTLAKFHAIMSINGVTLLKYVILRTYTWIQGHIKALKV